MHRADPSVTRRVGGLEICLRGCDALLVVTRRVGGLENLNAVLESSVTVTRRVGGLESNDLKTITPR